MSFHNVLRIPKAITPLLLGCMLATTATLPLLAQTAAPFGLEDSLIGTWAGTSSSETAVINNTAAGIRTGNYSLKLATSATSTGTKQWFSNKPYAASASGTYIYFVYWAKAVNSGTSVDASMRYSTTSPPTGSGSSSNASTDIALSTTGWTRVINSVTTSSARYYYPGPRKTVSTGATSFFVDDGIMYTSSMNSVDTTAPQTPGAPAAAVTGNLVNLSWTSNTDAGTGVMATIILRNSNTSAAPPNLADQAEYSAAGGGTGPNTVSGWTVVSTAVGPTATTYLDASAPPGNYKYAVVLRDLAYNYSIPSVSSTVTVGTPIPTIFVTQTGFTGNFGTVVRGTTSAAQQYSIRGFNLSGNITVSAPAGFEVSASATTGFASSVTFAQAGGSVTSTNVFVRFAPIAATGATGPSNITHTSTGATSQSVVVTGNSIDTEPTTTGTISFGVVDKTTVQVNLPTVGNGSQRIIVVSKEHDVTFVPDDGALVPGINADYSLATDQGGDEKVVYDGSGSGDTVVTVTGLEAATTYYFAVYEYNIGTGTSQNYLPVSPYTAMVRTALHGLGTASVSAGNLVRIYPNPAHSVLQVESSIPVTVLISDMSGRLLVQQFNAGRIDLYAFAPGMYIVSLRDVAGVVLKMERLLIQ